MAPTNRAAEPRFVTMNLHVNGADKANAGPFAGRARLERTGAHISPGRQAASHKRLEIRHVNRTQEASAAKHSVSRRLAIAPLPLAGSCTPVLALHSTDSYDYRFRSTAAPGRTGPAPGARYLVKYPSEGGGVILGSTGADHPISRATPDGKIGWRVRVSWFFSRSRRRHGPLN